LIRWPYWSLDREAAEGQPSFIFGPILPCFSSLPGRLCFSESRLSFCRRELLVSHFGPLFFPAKWRISCRYCYVGFSECFSFAGGVFGSMDPCPCLFLIPLPPAFFFLGDERLAGFVSKAADITLARDLVREHGRLSVLSCFGTSGRADSPSRLSVCRCRVRPDRLPVQGSFLVCRT